jgi:hypothetical protein
MLWKEADSNILEAAEIAKLVVPRGFGKSKTATAFKREARKMFKLAR